jgi:hypothetical protein
MTAEERQADEWLMLAKLNVKKAVSWIDPPATEPTAVAMLKILDSIDEARRLLATRVPAP